jgi:hypothetical protein
LVLTGSGKDRYMVRKPELWLGALCGQVGGEVKIGSNSYWNIFIFTAWKLNSNL